MFLSAIDPVDCMSVDCLKHLGVGCLMLVIEFDLADFCFYFFTVSLMTYVIGLGFYLVQLLFYDKFGV